MSERAEGARAAGVELPETDAIHGALVEALYKSKIGEYGYLGRPECEQFTEPLVPVVESLIAERIAAGQVHVQAAQPTAAAKSYLDTLEGMTADPAVLDAIAAVREGRPPPRRRRWWQRRARPAQPAAAPSAAGGADGGAGRG